MAAEPRDCSLAPFINVLTYLLTFIPSRQAWLSALNTD